MRRAVRRAVVIPEDEESWLTWVIDAAIKRPRPWRYYHTRDSRRSPEGFPDLVLWRERIVYAELKTERGKLSSAQLRVMDELQMAGAEFYVWRPSDRDEIRRVLA